MNVRPLLVLLVLLVLATSSAAIADLKPVETEQNNIVPPLIQLVLNQPTENPDHFVGGDGEPVSCPDREGAKASTSLAIETALRQSTGGVEHTWGVLLYEKKPQVWVVFYQRENIEEPPYIAFIGGASASTMAKALGQRVIAGGFSLQVDSEAEVPPGASELGNLIEVLPNTSQVQVCGSSVGG